ncbi:MAG: hypothetical protein SGI77_05345 [Pirellulaceae bacterium]|nr:hypothetical protein [Pirellulaceae bacterium]
MPHLIRKLGISSLAAFVLRLMPHNIQAADANAPQRLLEETK